MWATSNPWRRPFLFVAFSLATATAASSQGKPPSEDLRFAEARVNPATEHSECAGPPASTAALWRFERFGASPVFGDGLSDDGGTARFAVGRCLTAQTEVPRATPIPCQPASGAGTAWADGPRCADNVAASFPSLSGLGKDGLKISAARDGVLKILSSENACTEWFQTKDAFPARTLQTLSFEIDRHGQTDVLESPQKDGTLVFRHPYVAFAIQDGGSFTKVTINANGAFYKPQGRVDRLSMDGGPFRLDGMRTLMVGSYTGDTLAAQMVTILHELGHVINLLPLDGDDLDGSSMRNTDEVLRHCRPEVDGRVQEAKKGHHFLSWE